MKLKWLLRGLRTGIVTTKYPRRLRDELKGVRGLPRLAATDVREVERGRALAAVCLPNALRYDEGSRALTLEQQACIMCGLCAKIDSGDLITMTPDIEIARLTDRLRTDVARLFRRSLHLRHVDAGSCNGCESEIKMLTSPHYDLHRLGIFISTSPRAADGLLITGPITRAMEAPLRRTYDAMPDPKIVIAVGACGCTGGIFAGGALTHAGVPDVLPVDVAIPGCPPTPIALLHGLLLAVGRVSEPGTTK